MVIFLVLLNVFAFISLFFVWRWYKNSKIVSEATPTDFVDGCLHYNIYDFCIPFELCTDIEPNKIYYKRRGRSVTKVVDYGKYTIEIKVKHFDSVTLIEIYHTHILPQHIKCRFLGGITKTNYGYKCGQDRQTPMYLRLFKVCDEKIVGDVMAFSVYDKIGILCSYDEETHRRCDTYPINKVIVPPCTIKSPDVRLNEFLNFWVWDELGEITNSYDFDLGIIVCCMKMCYTKEGIGEFLKIHLVDNEIDITKKCLIIGMLCEYIHANGRDILDEKLGSYTLFDYVIGVLNRGSVRVKEEGIKAVKMYLIAVSEFINFVQSGDLKLKLYGVIDKLKEKYNFTKMTNSNYIEVYFGDDKRVDVKGAVAIMDRLTRGECDENTLMKANPLYLQKPMVPISKIGAGLLWRVVVHDVFGIRKIGENLTFKPCFPKPWNKVGLECLTGTGACKIDFLSSKCDIVKVDGVTFTGGVVPKGLGKGGKIEVYFSK